MEKRPISRKLLLWVMLAAFVMLPVCSASADDGVERPGTIRNLLVKYVNETTARLYWSDVKDADGYAVYQVNRTLTSRKTLVKITAPTRKYTLTGLKPGKTTYYQVYPYKLKNGTYYKSLKGSPVCEVETTVDKPGKVSNFRRICYGNKSVFLAWDAVKNADRYVLYIYDSDEKEYVRAATTADTTYQLKGLKVDETIKIIVRSYRSVNGVGAWSEPSDIVKAKGREVDVADVHGRYWSAYLKTQITTTNLTTGKKITLPAGTAFWTTASSGNDLTAIRTDGIKIKINGTSLRFTNLRVTPDINYYSKEQREAFVNGRGYESQTDYLIWINQYSSCLSVYKGGKGRWKQVLATDCVIGAVGHTSPGVFKLLKYGTKNGKPEIYFTWNGLKQWGCAIHCRLDRNVRGPHSMGCVRLGDKELYFVYNNCKLGTTVVSY